MGHGEYCTLSLSLEGMLPSALRVYAYHLVQKKWVVQQNRS